jgi:hypothetical protein
MEQAQAKEMPAQDVHASAGAGASGRPGFQPAGLGPKAPAAPAAGRAVIYPGMPAPAAGGHFLVPQLGLRFSGRLTYEAWADVGRQLSAVATSSAWCLGDWLIHGRRAYEGRYREAVKRTGLDYQTLRNYAWVARRFELSRRRDTLSFGHHAEVAALPEAEQDFWLRKADYLGWSTGQLRREVRSSLRGRSDATRGTEPARCGRAADVSQASTPTSHPESQVIQVPLTFEQSRLCEQAAHRHGLPVPAWAAQILDHAARHNV